jgi:hypothetical protein
MQTLLDAASHIVQEIERTRQHLINLEQALSGLQPLITIEATTTTLSYTATSFNQSVEDASIVTAEAPKKKAPQPKKAKKVKTVDEVQGKEPRVKKTSAEVAAKSKPEIAPKVGAKVKPLVKSEVDAVPKVKPKTVMKKASSMDDKSGPVVKQKTQHQPDTKVGPQLGKQSNIPATGADFWESCAGKREFNINELTSTALKKLGLEESTKPVIANRARAWITTAIKKGSLLPAGKRAGINSYKRVVL